MIGGTSNFSNCVRRSPTFFANFQFRPCCVFANDWDLLPGADFEASFGEACSHLAGSTLSWRARAEEAREGLGRSREVCVLGFRLRLPRTLDGVLSLPSRRRYEDEGLGRLAEMFLCQTPSVGCRSGFNRVSAS